MGLLRWMRRWVNRQDHLQTIAAVNSFRPFINDKAATSITQASHAALDNEEPDPVEPLEDAEFDSKTPRAARLQREAAIQAMRRRRSGRLGSRT